MNLKLIFVFLQVVMITGDSPLTACHVAKELHFISRKKETLILTKEGEFKFIVCTCICCVSCFKLILILTELDWNWVSINEETVLPCIPKNFKEFFLNYELCLTGDGMNYILDTDQKFFKRVLPHVRVFARVAPKQKVIN